MGRIGAVMAARVRVERAEATKQILSFQQGSIRASEERLRINKYMYTAYISVLVSADRRMLHEIMQ